MAIYRIDMKRQIGFTLIELMTGLAVAGVLLSLAVPSFNDHIPDAQARQFEVIPGDD